MDNLTPADRHKTMQAVKGKGTRLERRFFSMLAGMGLSGWRKNANDIIGKPDVIFSAAKVAIFVDGCFWHGCPVCQRKLPETNQVYWKQKITRNIRLAKQHDRQLRFDGWLILRIWEHEINNTTLRKAIRVKIRRIVKRGVKKNEEASEHAQKGKPSYSR